VTARLKTCPDMSLTANQIKKRRGAPSLRVLCETVGEDNVTAESGFVFGMPTLLKSGKDTRPKTVPKHAFLPKIYKIVYP